MHKGRSGKVETTLVGWGLFPLWNEGKWLGVGESVGDPDSPFS